MAHGPSTSRRQTNVDNNSINDDDFPIPPDGGWGWVVVFASFMIHIITDGMTYSFGIFFVEFLEYFKEGKGYTSWILSILVGVTLCSGPISSSFVTKYGCRLITIAGAFLAGACLIASVFAKSVLTLIFTIGIGTGFGLGMIYLPAIVSVTMYFENYRSLATGIAVCGSGFGTFIFAPLTEYLIKTYTWRGAMLIIAGIVLNCMVFGAMFRPLKSKKKKIAEKMELNKYIENNNSNLNECEMSQSQFINAGDQMMRSQSVNQTFTRKVDRNIIYEKNMEKNSLQNDTIRSTVSQPFLNGHHFHSTQHPHQYHQNQMTDGINKAMSRPDILYQGSLNNIPQYRSHGDLMNIDINMYGSIKNVEEKSNLKKKCTNGCIPNGASNIFMSMLNFTLLKDPIFIIFIFSNFCTSIGFNIPYVYLAAHAETLNINKKEASYLLAIIGIANTVGRIILGYISDKAWVNRLLVYNVSLTTCGVATTLSVFCYDFFSLSFYSAVFGFTIGAYVGLTSVILVDLLGLEKLTNAFGILLLFQGIASLIGPPLAGLLYDYSASYSPGFILAGITVTISGIVLFSIPIVQRHLNKKEITKSKEQQVQCYDTGCSL